MKKRKIFIFVSLIFIGLLLAPTPNQAAIPWYEIAYDDSGPESYLSLAENDSVAVRFSPPPKTFQLTGINLYANSNKLSSIRVWVLDDNNNTIMNPIYPIDSSGPPYQIDFEGSSPIFTASNRSDFYIVLQWIITDTSQFGIGIDNSTTSGRSYTNQSGTWQLYPTGNIIIHARIDDIIGPNFDHIPLQYAIEGKDLSISVNVTDEFGVDSVTLAYHDYNSNVPYATVSLDLASGTTMSGIWYGQIPGENVTSAGIEYYIWATDVGNNQRYHGNASNPFEVEVIQMFEMPLFGSIIIIVAITAAAILFYFYLPKYKGENVT
ncbi:MAG: hypothetical protein HWN66_12460 [Candidatus Helarchaeota archaeon]|nr:hypothetical protein [Candidatus Helarchaeota archaeon]